MNDEPPSSSVEPQRLGITKKIRDKIKGIYRNFSYKPQNKQDIAGSIRDSSDRGVLEKGTLSMMEGALKVSTAKVREIMIPKPQIIFVDSTEEPEDFLPRIIKSRHSRFPVFNKENEEIEGILLAKDLLPLLSPKNTVKLELNSLLRPAVLVPESKKLNTPGIPTGARFPPSGCTPGSGIAPPPRAPVPVYIYTSVDLSIKLTD